MYTQTRVVVVLGKDDEVTGEVESIDVVAANVVLVVLAVDANELVIDNVEADAVLALVVEVKDAPVETDAALNVVAA